MEIITFILAAIIIVACSFVMALVIFSRMVDRYSCGSLMVQYEDGKPFVYINGDIPIEEILKKKYALLIVSKPKSTQK